MVAYGTFYTQEYFYYWHKDSSPQAEVDYVITLNYKIIPVAVPVEALSKKAAADQKMRSREVKSGKGSTLKSLHYFLQLHEHSPYGIKFSTQNYTKLSDASTGNIIESYPLYAIAQLLAGSNVQMQAAIIALFD